MKLILMLWMINSLNLKLLKNMVSSFAEESLMENAG